MTGSIEDGMHVVVGASGGTGRVLVRELHTAGRRVRAVNRSGRLQAPPGVEVVGADATDAARMREVCAGAAVVYGRAWHVPHPDPLTGREIVETIFREAGARPRVTAHGSTAVRALGLVSPLVRAGAEMIYQFEMPFVVDGSRFARAFGAKPTPLDEAVRATLDWYRARPARRPLGR